MPMRGGPRRWFRQRGQRTLEATPEGSRQHGAWGRAWMQIKRAMIGPPIETSEQTSQRISKFKALAVFASDALSSVAYATEEILVVLVAAGSAALGLAWPIAVAIAILIGIVAFSYRQTIHKYPNGGGTYIVTQDTLGAPAALVAGSALLIDYVLTVAVSVSSGVAAITSAVQGLAPWAVVIGVAAVCLIALGNLRGVRQSANIFALPTYVFIVSVFALIGVGFFHAVSGAPSHLQPAAIRGTEPLGWFLILRAFASGCTAMTGTEAVSNGVPAFQDPQAKNAATTLTWMAAILGTMFLGITWLAHTYGIAPRPNETVLSQIARATAGTNWFYYLVQAATALILFLAANTSFADFPRLASFMSRDGYLSRNFAHRGDRLAFSSGIVTLALVAILLIVAFRASTDALIPLYAIGVFTAFTFSQTGMAYRWWTRREPGWMHGLPINGLGALVTGAVTLILAVAKFRAGAWMVLVVLPLLVLVERGIKRHYVAVERALELSDGQVATPPRPEVVVLVGSIDKSTEAGLAYALAIGSKVTALHVSEDPEAGKKLQSAWRRAKMPVPLEIVQSPTRRLIAPVLNYVSTRAADQHKSRVTVVIVEHLPQHWWGYMLHNRNGLRLKLALRFVPNVVLAIVPYRLNC